MMFEATTADLEAMPIYVGGTVITGKVIVVHVAHDYHITWIAFAQEPSGVRIHIPGPNY